MNVVFFITGNKKLQLILEKMIPVVEQFQEIVNHLKQGETKSK